MWWTALLLTAVPAMPQDPGPGISRELAVARKATVSDVLYRLRFDLTPGADTVEGEAFVRWTLPEGALQSEYVVMDFAGESLTEVSW